MAWAPPPPLSLSRERAADAAPEREAQEEVGEQRDAADQHADEQREADVVVADVRQLVADDALELLAVELLQEAGGDRDRCVLRVAAGGEGVGGGVVDDVDLGHRHVRGDRHLRTTLMSCGAVVASTSLRLRTREHEPVAAEARADAGQAAEDERDDR